MKTKEEKKEGRTVDIIAPNRVLQSCREKCISLFDEKDEMDRKEEGRDGGWSENLVSATRKKYRNKPCLRTGKRETREMKRSRKRP